MTVTKELTILALTKMRGGVCTAGIDGDGQWVRPVRPHAGSKQRYEAVTDYCLLPLDFFHGGHSHLVNLGVTRFWFASHTPQPPQYGESRTMYRTEARFSYFSVSYFSVLHFSVRSSSLFFCILFFCLTFFCPVFFIFLSDLFCVCRLK